MITKTELQQEIATLEAKLQEFKQQLSNYKEITIETAEPGDVLEDGSIVVKKENGLALLAAPASLEVKCQWSKDFPAVFSKLRDNGFNPSQWFVPTEEQLNLVYQNSEVRKHFAVAFYWFSTEVSSSLSKTNTFRVRPFRCVVY